MLISSIKFSTEEIDSTLDGNLSVLINVKPSLIASKMNYSFKLKYWFALSL